MEQILEGSRPVESIKHEARLIVEAATGESMVVSIAHQKKLNERAIARAVEMAHKRALGEPLQYVTGSATFRHIELKVGPGVFIPRPETEIVVEHALQRLPFAGTVVDIGTGSGAIALSIAAERPDARVFATEREQAAFQWALRNRAALGVEARLVLGDLFDGLPAELRGAVDVVVANPPYVDPSDARLEAEVRDHEPHDALFADAEGIAVIDRLVAESSGWMRPGGWLVLEIGEGQGARVAEIMNAGGFEDVAIARDLADRERVASGRSPTWRD